MAESAFFICFVFAGRRRGWQAEKTMDINYTQTFYGLLVIVQCRESGWHSMQTVNCCLLLRSCCSCGEVLEILWTRAKDESFGPNPLGSSFLHALLQCHEALSLLSYLSRKILVSLTRKGVSRHTSTDVFNDLINTTGKRMMCPWDYLYRTPGNPQHKVSP